jgi:hypothetical protein
MFSNQGHNGERFTQRLSRNWLRYAVRGDYIVTPNNDWERRNAVIAPGFDNLLLRDGADRFMGAIT